MSERTQKGSTGCKAQKAVPPGQVVSAVTFTPVKSGHFSGTHTLAKKVRRVTVIACYVVASTHRVLDQTQFQSFPPWHAPQRLHIPLPRDNENETCKQAYWLLCRNPSWRSSLGDYKERNSKEKKKGSGRAHCSPALETEEEARGSEDPKSLFSTQNLLQSAVLRVGLLLQE